MLTERLVYYERLTEFDAHVLKEENPRLAEYVSDLHGAWESRAILRRLRTRTGRRNSLLRRRVMHCAAYSEVRQWTRHMPGTR